MPLSIVLDQDLRITSGFWAKICSLEMIKQQLSTAYHPQTNGQSEALNQIIKDYLHVYCADELTA
jgi:transposase InsO family protein